jgi:hypothetical protein
MNDLNRLRVLSGLITESRDPEGHRTDTTQSDIIASFRDLLGILEKEYPGDENMKGIIYHYGGKLDSILHDAGPHEDEYDYGDEDDEEY